MTKRDVAVVAVVINKQSSGTAEPVLQPTKQNVAEPRHLSRCSICAHPERQSIEHAFLHKTMTVSDIHEKFGVGRDAIYRHAHALNLLPTRNRNWRGTVQSDNSAEVSTEAAEAEKTVLQPEKEETVYARAMIDLLLLKSDNELVSAIEEAIETKAHDSRLPIDVAANQIYVAGALTKIKREPDDWPKWFRNRATRTKSDSWRSHAHEKDEREQT